MISKNNKFKNELCDYFDGQYFKVFVILITSMFLSSCLSVPHQAPVSSRIPPPSTKISQHVVAPGDTLYSIAWRYGLDYKKLARANGINSGYQIFPGQSIFLSDKVSPKYRSKAIVSRPKTTNNSSSRVHNTVKKPSQNQRKTKPAQTIAPKKQIASTRSEKKSKTLKPSPSSSKNSGPLRWRWPANGIVTTNFHRQKGLRRGIDIDGKKGESVNAAASGKVVYAGSGLRGYGKLIIIKHNEIYLSAYAHNNQLRVSEGDFVKVGQRIADIGSTGVGTKAKPRLHFQIRRDGKPIDPLPLLPRR